MVLVIKNGDEIKYTEEVGLEFSKDDIVVKEAIPAPEFREGFFPILKYNETEDKLFYEYVAMND